MNDVPDDAMLDAGYRIVVGSVRSDVGWSVAARNLDDRLFVLCQGHPEYETLSLLREYRRDVRRYLFGRGASSYPRLPEGYLGSEAISALSGFERRATASRADPTELWARFPYDEVAPTVENTWASSSAKLYANWLGLARAAVPAKA
jgi:homoserine O-succinyltransferase